MPDIFGAQIFKSGVWNSDVYTDSDLDAMVSASQEIEFAPPVKLGHVDDQSAPSVGRVTNLKRIGHVLYADLVSLPQQIYDLIRARGYDSVSAEILWNLTRNGRTFPRVLAGVALLGLSLPAVDLAPLSTFLSIPPLPIGLAHAYAIDLVIAPLTRAEAGDMLVIRATTLQHSEKMTASAAMHRAIQELPAAAQAWSEL
jgi:hypothetical protein